MIGRSVGLILLCRVAKRWPKNRVETIVILKKREWPELCRGRLNPGGIGGNESDLVVNILACKRAVHTAYTTARTAHSSC